MNLEINPEIPLQVYFLTTPKVIVAAQFVLCMIKYKIKRKIVNCEKIESVTSHDLYPPPPVTNCHTFSDSLPLWSIHTLWTAPRWIKPDIEHQLHHNT